METRYHPHAREAKPCTGLSSLGLIVILEDEIYIAWRDTGSVISNRDQNIFLPLLDGKRNHFLRIFDCVGDVIPNGPYNESLVCRYHYRRLRRHVAPVVPVYADAGIILIRLRQ